MHNNNDATAAITFLEEYKRQADLDHYSELSKYLAVAIRSLKNSNPLHRSCLTCGYRDNDRLSAPCKGCYRTTSYVDSYIERDQCFDAFLNKISEECKEAAQGEYCIHGGVEGGLGYLGFGSCDLHTEVRYGCQHCPKNCKDFELASVEKLHSIYQLTKHD